MCHMSPLGRRGMSLLVMNTPPPCLTCHGVMSRKNTGTNVTARSVEASMPENTVMPIDLRAAAPALPLSAARVRRHAAWTEDRRRLPHFGTARQHGTVGCRPGAAQLCKGARPYQYAPRRLNLQYDNSHLAKTLSQDQRNREPAALQRHYDLAFA